MQADHSSTEARLSAIESKLDLIAGNQGALLEALGVLTVGVERIERKLDALEEQTMPTLDAAAAGRRIGRSRDWMYANKHLFKHSKEGEHRSGKLRFDRADLDRYVKEQTPGRTGRPSRPTPAYMTRPNRRLSEVAKAMRRKAEEK